MVIKQNTSKFTCEFYYVLECVFRQLKVFWSESVFGMYLRFTQSVDKLIDRD